jgi:hypothetical protein
MADPLAIDQPSAFEGFLRWTSRPGYAVRDLLAGNPLGSLKQLGDFAISDIADLFPIGNGMQLSGPGDYTDTSDLVGGMDDGFWKTATNVIGNTLTDPLTYVTFGASSGLSATKALASAGARGAMAAGDAADIAAQGAHAAALAEGLPDAIAQHFGATAAQRASDSALAPFQQDALRQSLQPTLTPKGLWEAKQGGDPIQDVFNKAISRPLGPEEEGVIPPLPSFDPTMVPDLIADDPRFEHGGFRVRVPFADTLISPKFSTDPINFNPTVPIPGVGRFGIPSWFPMPFVSKPEQEIDPLSQLLGLGGNIVGLAGKVIGGMGDTGENIVNAASDLGASARRGMTWGDQTPSEQNMLASIDTTQRNEAKAQMIAAGNNAQALTPAENTITRDIMQGVDQSSGEAIPLRQGQLPSFTTAGEAADLLTDMAQNHSGFQQLDKAGQDRVMKALQGQSALSRSQFAQKIEKGVFENPTKLRDAAGNEADPDVVQGQYADWLTQNKRDLAQNDRDVLDAKRRINNQQQRLSQLAPLSDAGQQAKAVMQTGIKSARDSIENSRLAVKAVREALPEQRAAERNALAPLERRIDNVGKRMQNIHADANHMTNEHPLPYDEAKQQVSDLYAKAEELRAHLENVRQHVGQMNQFTPGGRSAEQIVKEIEEQTRSISTAQRSGSRFRSQQAGLNKLLPRIEGRRATAEARDVAARHDLAGAQLDRRTIEEDHGYRKWLKDRKYTNDAIDPRVHAPPAYLSRDYEVEAENEARQGAANGLKARSFTSPEEVAQHINAGNPLGKDFAEASVSQAQGHAGQLARQKLGEHISGGTIKGKPFVLANSDHRAMVTAAIDKIRQSRPDFAAELDRLWKGLPPRGPIMQILSGLNKPFKQAAVMGIGLPRVMSLMRNRIAKPFQALAEAGTQQNAIGGGAFNVPRELKQFGTDLGGTALDGLHSLGMAKGIKGGPWNKIFEMRDDAWKTGGDAAGVTANLRQAAATETNATMKGYLSHMADFIEAGGEDGYTSSEEILRTVASASATTKWQRFQGIMQKPIFQWPAIMWKSMEDRMRFGMYMDLRTAGQQPMEAAKNVSDMLYNYQVSGVENRTMRDLFPFGQFFAKAVKQNAKLLSETPVAAIALNPLFGQGPKNPLYQYMQGKVNIPLGKDTQGNDQYISGLGLPVESLAQVPIPGGDIWSMPQAFRRDVIGQLNPTLKTAFAFASGQDPYFETPFGSFNKTPAVAQALGAPARSDVARDYNLAAGTGLIQPLASAVNMADVATDARTTLGEKAIDSLSGASVVSVDEKVAEQQLIQNYLRHHPEVQQYTSFYTKDDNPQVKALTQELAQLRQQRKQQPAGVP